MPLPLKWMSPESLSFNKISKESDVWSYGVLLWEIYSYGCTPYPSLPLEQILEKLTSGYRMEQPKDCDDYVYKSIMLKCWDFDPKKRPKFSELVSHLDNLINQPDYINLKALIEKQKLESSDKLKQQLNTSLKEDEEVASQSTKMTHTSTSDCSEFSDSNQVKNLSNYLTTSASSFNPYSSSSSSSSTSSKTESTRASHSYSSSVALFNEIKNDDSNRNERLLSKRSNLSKKIKNSNLNNRQKFAYITINKNSLKKNPIYIGRDALENLESNNQVKTNEKDMKELIELEDDKEKKLLIELDESNEKEFIPKLNASLAETSTFLKLPSDLFKANLDSDSDNNNNNSFKSARNFLNNIFNPNLFVNNNKKQKSNFILTQV